MSLRYKKPKVDKLAEFTNKVKEVNEFHRRKNGFILSLRIKAKPPKDKKDFNNYKYQLVMENVIRRRKDRIHYNGVDSPATKGAHFLRRPNKKEE